MPEDDPGSRRESDDAPEDDSVSVVSVDRGDDVASICGRIDTAPTFAVVLDVPRGNRNLGTELGMRRLRRHVEDSGKIVAIATRSSAVASRARQVSIPVSRDPEHVRWDSGGRTVFALPGGRTMVAPPVERYLHLVIILLAIAVILALALTMGPKATIIAYPETEEIRATVAVTGSPDRDDIDLASLQVPVRSVSATKTFTLVVKPTGKARVGRETARVALTVTNPTPAAVTVPAGAIVAGPGEGITYRISTAVTIAPGATAQGVEAVATRAGAEFNLAANSVRAWADEPLRILTVNNPAAAAGGTTEEVAAIDPKDIATIREQERVIREAQTIRRVILEGRPRDAVFLNTAEVDAEETSEPPVAGTPSELLIVDYRVTVSAQAILQDTLERIAREVLAERAGEGAFIPGSVTAVEVGPTTLEEGSNNIKTRLELSGQFARGLAEGDVRDAVRGRSPASAEAALKERYRMQDAEVQLNPGWAPWIPRFGFRIDVEFRPPLVSEPAAGAGGGAAPTARD